MEDAFKMADVATRTELSRKSASALKRTKYPALALLCLVYFFVMVNYEGPASLQTVIMRDLSYTTTKFSLLMSASTWPSALSFLGGLLTDRYLGIDRGLLVLSVIFCMGSLLFSIGMYKLDFSTMIAGRIVSGWSGEAIGAIVSWYIVLWFSDGGMNTAFAISWSTTLIEPAIIYQLSTSLYLDMIRQDESHENRQLVLGHVSALLMSSSLLLVICSVVVAALHTKTVPLNTTGKEDSAQHDKRKSSVLDVLRLPLIFWLLSICAAAVQAASFSFISMSQDFFVSFYKLDLQEANNIVSYSSIFSCVGLPLVGLLVDKTGRNLYYVLFSIILAITAHLAMTFTSIYPLVPVMLLSGSSISFQAAFYKLVSDSVSEHQLGTAYGIAISLENIGSGTGFLIVGILTDNLGDQYRQYFFLSLFIVALILCLLLFYLDINTNNGVLTGSEKERRQYRAACSQESE